MIKHSTEKSNGWEADRKPNYASEIPLMFQNSEPLLHSKFREKD